MPKRIQLRVHLSMEELERRYRGARDPVERSHDQISWLLSHGRSTSEVLAVTGYSRRWIQELARRSNERGAAGVGDRRCRNPGAERLLSRQQQEALGQALSSPPPDGGMWNSRKVAAWIGERTGRPVGVQRGWDYLRHLGRTPVLATDVIHAFSVPSLRSHRSSITVMQATEHWESNNLPALTQCRC